VLARLLVQKLFGSQQMPACRPGMCGTARDELVAKVLRRRVTVTEGAIELCSEFVVEKGGYARARRSQRRELLRAARLRTLEQGVRNHGP
jgi:hypothetical protein